VPYSALNKLAALLSSNKKKTVTYFLKTTEGGVVGFAGTSDTGTADTGDIKHSKPATLRIVLNEGAPARECCHNARFSWDVLPVIDVAFGNPPVVANFNRKVTIKLEMVYTAHASGCPDPDGAPEFNKTIKKEVSITLTHKKGEAPSGKITVTDTIDGTAGAPVTTDAEFK